MARTFLTKSLICSELLNLFFTIIIPKKVLEYFNFFYVFEKNFRNLQKLNKVMNFRDVFVTKFHITFENFPGYLNSEKIKCIQKS